VASRLRSARGRYRLVTDSLESYFGKHGRPLPWRRSSAANYKRVISEVLLQQTRAETVARMFPAFCRRFPSWRKLARATISQLERELKPLGIWRRRARSLKKLAVEMDKRHGRFPSTREELEQLPAVGQYVASAILLFCHGKPEPLLDVNMARILERYFGPRKLADIRHDPYLQDLARKVVKSSDDPVKINWAILDLGAMVCTARNPRCRECPLKRGCKYRKKQAAVEGCLPSSSTATG
jgi:A/G-specific adenine glycosylase